MIHKHPWQARLGVALAMLILAFIGMVVTDLNQTGGWDYWKWVIPIYAILALWLSWYTRKRSDALRPVTIWHELLHWTGLILAVVIVSYLQHLGTISRFAAGLFDLVLLSLAVFLAGIYIEATFFVIGIALGLLALFSGFILQYLWSFVLPILVAAAIVVGLTIWISHRKKNG